MEKVNKSGVKCEFCHNNLATHVINFNKIDSWYKEGDQFIVDSSSGDYDLLVCKSCWSNARKEILPTGFSRAKSVVPGWRKGDE